MPSNNTTFFTTLISTVEDVSSEWGGEARACREHSWETRACSAYLYDHAGRLAEVPQRKAKQTHQGRLGLKRLRATSAEDAATRQNTHTLADQMKCMTHAHTWEKDALHTYLSLSHTHTHTCMQQLIFCWFLKWKAVNATHAAKGDCKRKDFFKCVPVRTGYFLFKVKNRKKMNYGTHKRLGTLPL